MRYISKPKPAPSTIATIATPTMIIVSSVCWGSWLGVGDVEGEVVGGGVGVRVGTGAFGSGIA
jgi:hypothetical protein